MLGEQKLELISEWFVKPKHQIEVGTGRIYLNALEICMLGIHPIQKGLLFTLNQPTHNNLCNLLNNLKSSLSIALAHFYPLAGQFATETSLDERACTVFIDCNKGEGARVIHAVAPNVTVSDIVLPLYVPAIVQNFFDFGQRYVNYDGHTRPLLSIQVTELVDGIFLGFSMNHSALDGTSFMHFVKMLSQVFFDVENNISENVEGISRVPVYDHSGALKLPYQGLDEIMIWRDNGPLMDRIFHFSHGSLAALKTEASQGCGTKNISSFQALASFVWKSITKARNLSADEETSCCLVTNARTRLDPPLTDDYFGNYISQVKVTCTVGELLTHDLGWAAMLLNDGIKAKNYASIRDAWNKVVNVVTTVGFPSLVADIHGQNNVVIGGSTRFDMYEAEFGLGKAVAVRMGFGNKDDGKVTANQGCEGIGNVDLEISLRAHNMASLVADHEFMKFVTPTGYD